MASHKDPPESIDVFEKRKPPAKPIVDTADNQKNIVDTADNQKKERAPRSDKGAPRQPPSAVEIIRKRQTWVTERLAKIEPEYQALKREQERNQIALDALERKSTP